MDIADQFRPQGEDTMKIALGSDEKNHLTDAVIEEVRARGHQVSLFGPLADGAQ